MTCGHPWHTPQRCYKCRKTCDSSYRQLAYRKPDGEEVWFYVCERHWIAGCQGSHLAK